MEEVILGDQAEFLRVETGVRCKTTDNWMIGCCPLGERVLVMSGQDRDVSASLVDVEEGRLSERSVHITTLTVQGDAEWSTNPFLCRASGDRALLYFDDWDRMWYCDVAGDTLTMRKLGARMPTDEGFGTAPVRLPDGRLLVAGGQGSGWSFSAAVMAIFCDEEPRFERLGDIPGAERASTSAVLAGGRFLLGFGGWCNGNLGDLWVFDAAARRGSRVRKEGEWHPEDCPVPFIVQDGTLYLLGGENSKSINLLSLRSLAGLIEDAGVRRAFCRWRGLPWAPGRRFWRPLPRRHPPRL